jgi:hypothetical protein
MPSNPAIAMGVRGIELQDPLAQYGRVAAIQGAQQQNALAQLQMQQAQREQESTNALNRAYAEAYNPQTGDIDLNKLRQSLSTGGFGSKLPGLEKTLAELRKEKLTQQKLEGEIAGQPLAREKLQGEIAGQALTQQKLQGEIAGQATTQAMAQANLVEAKLKQARSFLDTIDPNDPTAPQKYIAWHEANHKDPVLGPLLESRGITADQSRAQIAQAIQQGPQAFAELLNKSKLGTERFMELNKPIVTQQTLGGTVRAIQTPGLGGAATVVPGSEAAVTMTTAQIEQDKRDRERIKLEGQRIGLEGRRVKVLEENARRDADPAFQQRMSAARTVGQKAAEGNVAAQQALPRAISGAEEGIRLIDELIGKRDPSTGKLVEGSKPHPGFQNAVGATWLPGIRFVPGTDAAGFMSRFDQIKGASFLEAFESLKGGGAITEKEGQKGTDAINRMSISTDEKEFVRAAMDLQDVIRKGVANAQRRAGGAGGAVPGGAGAVDTSNPLLKK